MAGKASKSWLSNTGENQTIQCTIMIGPEGAGGLHLTLHMSL
jgi:hypothetical protein